MAETLADVAAAAEAVDSDARANAEAVFQDGEAGMETLTRTCPGTHPVSWLLSEAIRGLQEENYDPYRFSALRRAGDVTHKLIPLDAEVGWHFMNGAQASQQCPICYFVPTCVVQCCPIAQCPGLGHCTPPLSPRRCDPGDTVEVVLTLTGPEMGSLGSATATGTEDFIEELKAELKKSEAEERAKQPSLTSYFSAEGKVA